jgi:hypothetical protein
MKTHSTTFLDLVLHEIEWQIPGPATLLAGKKPAVPTERDVMGAEPVYTLWGKIRVCHV